MTPWIDICVNLTDRRFADQQEQVIERAITANVSHMVVAGTSLESSEAALALCHQFPDNLYCTAGVHPHDAKDATPATFNALRSLAAESSVVAIGETGLDFNRDFSPRPQQVAVFERQLELAAETDLPLLLHERDAHNRQREILTSYRDHIKGAVAHCFTGDRKALYNYLDLDLYIGITGWVCDERRGNELRELVRDIPDNRLLLETDAPYLLPRDLRPKPKGGRNEPACLVHIAETVASLRGTETDELRHQVFANTQELFQLPL